MKRGPDSRVPTLFFINKPEVSFEKIQESYATGGNSYFR